MKTYFPNSRIEITSNTITLTEERFATAVLWLAAMFFGSSVCQSTSGRRLHQSSNSKSCYLSLKSLFIYFGGKNEALRRITLVGK